MNNGHEGTGQGPAASGARSPLNPARRRLLRAGAGASPVLLTIASAPVSATTCFTASASTSITPSGMARRLNHTPCAGRSPATWASAVATDWPADVPKATARFNAFFSPGLMTDYLFTDLFATTGGGQLGLARACAATLLNAKTNRVPNGVGSATSPHLAVGNVQSIWTVSNGIGFQPTAGITWTHDQTSAWLAATWT